MSAGTSLRKPTFSALYANERDDRHDSAYQELPPTTLSKPAMQTMAAPGDPTLVPAIIVSDVAHNQSQNQDHESSFQPLLTNIPTGSLDDLFDPENVEFSRSGSMLLGGSRANGRLARNPSSRSLGERQPLSRGRRTRLTIPSTRALSADEDMLSRRVRSMYEHGNESAANWESISEQDNAGDQDDAQSRQDSATPTQYDLTVPKPRVDGKLMSNGQSPRVSTISTATSVSAGKAKRTSFIQREPAEAAGGIEDWQDVESNEVDRYGFIRKGPSRASSGHSNVPPSDVGGGLHRVTTSLQLASEAPRRKRTIRRVASSAAKSTHRRTRSKQGAAQTKSISSYQSGNTAGRAGVSPLRFVSNRLPHNRERRMMEEAGDMLTVRPGLEESETAASQLVTKKKEWEREEKWRKMGRVTQKDAHGGGTIFDFDLRSSKLINRTWKGIPDRWRATAWWAFLADSARKTGMGEPGGESEEELIEAFHEAQERSSADDVQIDVDMPRTISNHIMFRRRYRGGQRLLFSVARHVHIPARGRLCSRNGCDRRDAAMLLRRGEGIRDDDAALAVERHGAYLPCWLRRAGGNARGL